MTDDDPQATGADRTSAVLDPSFVDGLDGLSVQELRRRRDLALAEREFQSYLRRLVQVRQDILEAERTRRTSGATAEPLVERLTSVLSEGPQGGSRGEAMVVRITESDMAEAERRAAAAAGAAGVQGLESIADADLQAALASLDEQERSISSDRASVIRVHDRLQQELKHRYREDPSQIPLEI